MTRPFQRLRDRIAGRPVDTKLYADVEPWLETPLREWLQIALVDAELVARSVALRLKLARSSSSYTNLLVNLPRADLLDAVDAVLELHTGWDGPGPGYYSFDPPPWTLERWKKTLSLLESTLRDGQSLFRIDLEERRLVERVDQTVQAAMDTAVKSATSQAAEHLREAWKAAYGRDPDPDKVFNEAVRAVEEVACPLVEQKRAGSNASTLGTVIGTLTSAPHKWELVLPIKSGNPRDAASLVGMMDTLWQAQLSRHGGGSNSRRQSEEEARAAVHLAALLVQWLSTGVLRKKV